MSQTRNGTTATLVVKPSNVDSFQNRQIYCTNIKTNFLHLFISSASKYKRIVSLLVMIQCNVHSGHDTSAIHPNLIDYLSLLK